MEFPGGYDVADPSGRQGQVSSGYASTGKWGGFATSHSAPVYDDELLVKCHGAPADHEAVCRDEEAHREAQRKADDAQRRTRECMASTECDTGDRCVFPEGGGAGRCAPPR